MTPAEGTEAAEVEQGPAATQNTTGDKAEGGWDIMKLLPSIYGDPTPTGDPALPVRPLDTEVKDTCIQT